MWLLFYCLEVSVYHVNSERNMTYFMMQIKLQVSQQYTYDMYIEVRE